MWNAGGWGAVSYLQGWPVSCLFFAEAIRRSLRSVSLCEWDVFSSLSAHRHCSKSGSVYKESILTWMLEWSLLFFLEALWRVSSSHAESVVHALCPHVCNSSKMMELNCFSNVADLKRSCPFSTTSSEWWGACLEMQTTRTSPEYPLQLSRQRLGSEHNLLGEDIGIPMLGSSLMLRLV